jgi:hypothetical protein
MPRPWKRGPSPSPPRRPIGRPHSGQQGPCSPCPRRNMPGPLCPSAKPRPSPPPKRPPRGPSPLGPSPMPRPFPRPRPRLPSPRAIPRLRGPCGAASSAASPRPRRFRRPCRASRAFSISSGVTSPSWLASTSSASLARNAGRFARRRPIPSAGWAIAVSLSKTPVKTRIPVATVSRLIIVILLTFSLGRWLLRPLVGTGATPVHLQVCG